MVPAASVVVALVSGGPDSVAMLRLLHSGALGHPAALRVLHVNHLLRGDDADADARFVADLADELGLACDVVRYDVAAHAEEQGLNLEDAGRRVRYRLAATAMASRCDELGVSHAHGRVCVGHTFDDRLETYLWRVVTGAGAGALSGIPPARDHIVRPLIEARRADVLAYLESIDQQWRTDATNADTLRKRAWVRHELLPLIESQNPSFEHAAARTMEILSEEDLLLSEMAGLFAHDFARREDGALVFERAFMCTLSRPMVRRTVREALIRAFPEASRLEFEHTDALADGVDDDCFARDLPFGLRAECEYGRMRVYRRGDAPALVAPGLLGLPATLDLGGAGRIKASLSDSREVTADADEVSIDADSVTWPLVVDAPRDGDRIRPLGMDGTKKVSDLLIDSKVPKRLRSSTPVLRDGDRIVWVAGVRLSEESKVTSATKRVARLVWKRS